MSKRPVVTSRINKKQLNPVFHLQTKKEDADTLSLNLIKQARSSGVLNLSGRGLANVPEKIWRLYEDEKDSHGDRLDMDKKTDDEVWWNQKMLTNLDLSSNMLTCISSDLQNLLDLTVLNLHDNSLTSLPSEIGKLDKLTKINVSRNKISRLPKEFFKLRELKQLNLSHNKFIELDSDIADLIMLETLDLSFNNLTTVPGGIGFLVRLTQLTLSHNKLVDLPNDIVNLRALQKLELTHNNLESLPKPMSELRKLECLYAQHNDIKELPEFIGCDALREIHLSNNFITEIEANFCESLPLLRTLDLRDNKIERLPDEIALLQSLMRLDLSNNSINSLPNGLATLAHLVSLQLDGNPIRSIRRDIIQGGTNRILKTLRDRSGLVKSEIQPTIIGDNENFPDVFQMKKTHSLSMVMKNLTEIPENVFMDAKEASVNNIDLSKNKLSSVPEGVNHLHGILSELNLSNNLLKTLPQFLSQFERIQFINISSNSFSELPKELGLLNTLRELNISNNHFVNIPNCVFELKGLEILLARDNRIEVIDASSNGLGAMKRLSTLDLANNNLSQVPAILGNLTNITTLELNGNKFRQPRHQILAKGTESIMSYLRDRIPI